MKNISLVTLATDNLPYKEASLSNKKAYCKKHDYNFVSFSESLDEGRPTPWSKIKAMEEVLDGNKIGYETFHTDWAVWIDADAFIMNDEIKLESFINEEYAMIIALDSFTVNTGVFFLKNTENSKEFLSKCYEKTHFSNHPWWEQAAVIEYLNEPNGLKVKTLHQREINSYPSVLKEITNSDWTKTKHQLFFNNRKLAEEGSYEEGDFILHFAGFKSQEDKLESIKSYDING